MRLMRIGCLILILSTVTIGLAGNPDSPSSFLETYRAFMQQRQEKLASITTQENLDEFLKWQRSQLDRLLSIIPANENRKAEDLVPVATLLQMSGNHAAAAAIFRSVRQIRPDDLEAAAGLITSLLELGSLDEAQAVFSQTKDRLSPNQYFALAMRLSRELTESGQLDTAGQLLAEIKGKNPPEGILPMLYELMADKEVAAGRKQAAQTLLQAQIAASAGRQPITKNLQDKLQQIALLQEKAPEAAFSKWIGPPLPQSSWNGKVILLDFWAPWCSPCRAEIGQLKKIYQRFHSQGLELIGVTMLYGNFFDGLRRVPNVPPEREFALLGEYVQAQAIPWSIGVAPDAALQGAYHVTGLPHLVLIDRQGVVRHVEVGFNPYSSRLEQKVGKLIEE